MTATVAGIHLGLDTHAARPAANTVSDGSLYSCSTHNLIYKSNYLANTWATWGTLSSVAADLASGRVMLTGGNLTTSSTSFVDLTGATVTLTTGARRCLVLLQCYAFNSSSGNAEYYDVAVDGVLQGGTEGLANVYQISGGADDHSVTLAYVTAALSAGAHTIKVQWKVSGGTGTTRASSNAPIAFSVVELYAS